MVFPTLTPKISIVDFNRMQDFISVYDSYDHPNGVVDAADTAIAIQDFAQYKKGDTVPFAAPKFSEFFSQPAAYRFVTTQDQAVKIAQEYGFSLSRPADLMRCTCLQYAVWAGGERFKDIYGENVNPPVFNEAVLRHEFEKIAEPLKFTVDLPAEVAVRMAKYGAVYNSYSGHLTFKNDDRGLSLYDLAHPTKSAVFRLAAEEYAIILTAVDDTGVKKYKVFLEHGGAEEIKDAPK